MHRSRCSGIFTHIRDIGWINQNHALLFYEYILLRRKAIMTKGIIRNTNLCTILPLSVPFIKDRRVEILYEGESPWKHVNRFGDTNLKFVSYRLKEVREKRRQGKLERKFPPPARRPETYYDSQSFGTDDNYSINATSYINER